ncbi:MAG: sensory histidine kinase AtoS [Syntrophus sp. PtaU1.Bin208]|nr:MAG: sensory histidine kinase AtoS [Syntrophus sp. PtaU1.Bin208]
MDLLGYEEDEILMKPIEGFVLSEDWPMVRENYRKRLSEELDNIHSQFRMIKKNGDVIFVEAHGSRIQYKGQPTIIGTMIDTTDRKHAEEELHHRMKLQGILEMSGTICHEFNQPMQAVSCCTELLMSCSSADVNCHRKLQMIKEQTKRMGKITMKLMTLNNYSVKNYIGIGNIVDIHKN